MKAEWAKLVNYRKRFIPIPLWMLGLQSFVSGDSLKLLAYLASHTQGYDPGSKQITEETGIQKRQIMRLLDGLVRSNAICRTPGGTDFKRKTYRTNIHMWALLSHVSPYGPFPICHHCGYHPGHIGGDNSSPVDQQNPKSHIGGDNSSPVTPLRGDNSSPVEGTNRHYILKNTKEEITKEGEGAKAPPPPPPSKPKKTNFQLDAQTPQDLEEKPAKKKPNQKSSRQPPFSPVVDGNDYSGILALIYELEPLGWKINRQKLLDFLSHETWSHYSLEEKHLIVTHYRDTWIDKSDDDIKALKKRKKPSSPSQAGLRPYLKNPKYGLKDELERLKLSNSQGSNLYGDELFPLLKSNPNDLSKQSKIE